MPPQPTIPQIPVPTLHRNFKAMELWIGGVNSQIHPTVIPPNQYAWGENIITRGGIPQTRPGMRFIASIPGDNLQGMTLFKPTNSALSLMVIAVDGRILYAFPPYKSFVQINGIQFRADAPIVNFCVALQSVQNNLDGTISLISPKRVLMIQDGSTRAAFWDGYNTSRHLDPTSPVYETPVGLWMSWANSRLWVARGSQVFTSDIANPLSFTENTYLAEASGFELPDDCTGLQQTTDLTGLLAFTSNTTTVFQSSIRNRSTWQTTPGFQTLLIPNVGCAAGRSIVNQYGLTYWLSPRGVVSLDAALATKHTSRLITVDAEMMRSKRKLNSDLSRSCGVAFENMMLLSVPSGAKANCDTWVQDQTPLAENSALAGGNWTGVWTGFQPVSWAVSHDGSHCYCATSDQTELDSTPIHIWEAFDSSREDNEGGRVSCQFETAMVSYPTKQRFAYAEIDLCEIVGKVDLQVYFGCVKGPWIKVLDTVIQADGDSVTAGMALTKYSVLQSYLPQCRTVRTSDFSPQGLAATVESTDIPGVDKSHGLLFQWQGRMGIRRVIIATTEEPQSVVGKPAAVETHSYAIDAEGNPV